MQMNHGRSQTHYLSHALRYPECPHDSHSHFHDQSSAITPYHPPRRGLLEPDPSVPDPRPNLLQSLVSPANTYGAQEPSLMRSEIPSERRPHYQESHAVLLEPRTEIEEEEKDHRHRENPESQPDKRPHPRVMQLFQDEEDVEYLEQQDMTCQITPC
jgi:hypothetical protein